MLKIPEKTQYFNDLLLSISWDNVKFDSHEFKDGLILDNKVFTAGQIKFFEILLAIVPEWRRVIGCRQHKTHSFCLDIHIITVIKKIIEQRAFKELDDYYKLVILWGGLLHDIEKKENVVDPEHPLKGAEKTELILNRLGFDEHFVNSVYTLVRYHPVIGFMIIDKMNLSVADFMNKIGDEKLMNLFIIFAIADIKAVQRNDAFYNDSIDNSIKYIHSEMIKILSNHQL